MTSSLTPLYPSAPCAARQVARRCAYRQGGLTLVELMIALALGLVVTGAALTVFLSNREAYRLTENLARIHDDARIVFEQMARDIREAGGIPCGSTLPIANVLNNPSSNWWSNWADGGLHGYSETQAGPKPFGTGSGDRVSGTDAILIRSGTLSEGVVVTDHNPASAQFKVNTSNHGISDGDIVMACDNSQAAIFQVTNTNSTNKIVVHNTGTGTPGNCTKGLGLPVTCTAVGTSKTFDGGGLLTKLSASFWYIGHNGRGGRSLYRLTMSGNTNAKAEEMAEGVTDMNIEYLTSDGASPPTLSDQFVTADSITDWSDAATSRVVAVRIQLTHATQEAVSTDRTALQRNTYLAISLRNREYHP